MKTLANLYRSGALYYAIVLLAGSQAAYCNGTFAEQAFRDLFGWASPRPVDTDGFTDSFVVAVGKTITFSLVSTAILSASYVAYKKLTGKDPLAPLDLWIRKKYADIKAELEALEPTMEIDKAQITAKIAKLNNLYSIKPPYLQEIQDILAKKSDNTITLRQREDICTALIAEYKMIDDIPESYFQNITYKTNILNELYTLIPLFSIQ